MTKLKDNISIYLSMLLCSIKSMMEYRIDFIIGMISQLLTQVVELIFIWIVFQNTETLAGWTFDRLLLLYGITMLTISIVDFLFDSIYDIGPKYIKDGEFDKLLLRPIHPLISVMGDTKSLTAFGYMLISLILIISMLIKLQINITFVLIAKIILFAFSGALIIGAIMIMLSVTSFYTYKSNEIIWSVYKIYTFAQYPIEIYNKFIRILITIILPFAFATYYPTLNYLNMENGWLMYLSPLVAIIFLIIAVKIWNWGLNKYRSTGN